MYHEVYGFDPVARKLMECDFEKKSIEQNISRKLIGIEFALLNYYIKEWVENLWITFIYKFN